MHFFVREFWDRGTNYIKRYECQLTELRRVYPGFCSILWMDFTFCQVGNGLLLLVFLSSLLNVFTIFQPQGFFLSQLRELLLLLPAGEEAVK